MKHLLAAVVAGVATAMLGVAFLSLLPPILLEGYSDSFKPFDHVEFAGVVVSLVAAGYVTAWMATPPIRRATTIFGAAAVAFFLLQYLSRPRENWELLVAIIGFPAAFLGGWLRELQAARSERSRDVPLGEEVSPDQHANGAFHLSQRNVVWLVLGLMGGGLALMGLPGGFLLLVTNPMAQVLGFPIPEDAGMWAVAIYLTLCWPPVLLVADFVVRKLGDSWQPWVRNAVFVLVSYAWGVLLTCTSSPNWAG